MKTIARRPMLTYYILLSLTCIAVVLLGISYYIAYELTSFIMRICALILYTVLVMVQLLNNEIKPIALIKYKGNKLDIFTLGEWTTLTFDEINRIDMKHTVKCGKTKRYGDIVIFTNIDKYEINKVGNVSKAYSLLCDIVKQVRQTTATVQDNAGCFEQQDELTKTDNNCNTADSNNSQYVHNMNLVATAFDKIASGSKTIELRLYDAKRRTIKVGDKIKFVCKERQNFIKCQVKSIHVFSDFESLYKSLPLDKCGYSKDNLHTASAQDMLQYYTEQQIEYYGVVGIELCDVQVTSAEEY